MDSKRLHRRYLSTLAFLAGAFCFWLTPAADAVSQSTSFQDTQGNSSENSNGRKIVANNFGYWAFGDFGFPGVAFSTDTVNWTVGHIFNRLYNDSDGVTM